MLRFFRRGAPPRLGQAVVAPPLIVIVGVRPLGQLFDQPFVEQPLDRRIERAGAEADGAAGPLVHVLHDRVAVPLAVGEGHEDVEGVPGQWPHGGGL